MVYALIRLQIVVFVLFLSVAKTFGTTSECIHTCLFAKPKTVFYYVFSDDTAL